jgi:hypothetical protein
VILLRAAGARPAPPDPRGEAGGDRAAASGDPAAAPDHPRRAGGRLADLISYRDLVDRAFEWPWDTPTLLRVALYMSLGVGSWLGGALVERALAIVLG